MFIHIDAVDTLFFRDSRPFDAGTDTFAESTLPSPLAIYGAIGNYVLSQNKTDVPGFLRGEIEDGTLGKYNNSLQDTRLKIKGVFLTKGGEIYLPAPANLFKRDNEAYWVATPGSKQDLKWDIDDMNMVNLRPLALPEEDCKPVEAYVWLAEMKEKLLQAGEVIQIGEFKNDIFFMTEQRVGHRIRRDASVVEEGFLYSAGHLRPNEELRGRQYAKGGLLVVVEGLDGFQVDGIISLGGEGRKAKLSSEKTPPLTFQDIQAEVLSKVKQNRRFFVYLLTPSIFANGWTRGEWPDEFKGATLVGATVNKPVYFSGWQRSTASQGTPRPMRKAVPQGSVYFFEVANDWDDKNFEILYETYNLNESLSEEYPSAGFGISLIGVW